MLPRYHGHRDALPPPVLGEGHVGRPAVRLEAARPAAHVPVDVADELGGELADAAADPRLSVEELLLERAEDALGPRVVRAGAPPGHRPDGAGRLALRLPARRPVAGAPVRVHDRAGVARLDRERRRERRGAELPAGARRDRQADRAAVPADQDGARVDLAGREPELGDVRNQQLAGALRGEVAGEPEVLAGLPSVSPA